jgi:hypothetical protein
MSRGLVSKQLVFVSHAVPLFSVFKVVVFLYVGVHNQQLYISFSQGVGE